jgi:hypothetical protein
LEVLKRVNATNRESAIPKVGHEVFYIPELTERVNLPDDYYKWVTDGPNSKVTAENNPQNNSFEDYILLPGIPPVQLFVRV